MALKIAKKSKKRKIDIYLRTEMPRVEQLFFPKKQNIELHILNQSGLTARQFVSEHPLITCVPSEKINELTVDFNFNVLLLGFGWQGRELLHKTICDAQFKGSNFAATIIDRDINLKNGEYKLLFNKCISEYHLSFMDDEEIRNIGSKCFYQWFKENYPCFDRIIVALGDDKLNIHVSLALADIMIAGGEETPEEKLFVRVANADKHLYSHYPVTMFGRLDKIYTCDEIIAESMDQVAKAVNLVYSNTKVELFKKINEAEAEKDWVKISTFNKDSSRAVALNVKNIIEKIAGGKAKFSESIQDPKKLDILAENEHLRWNAFHFTQGITVWNEIKDDNKHDAKLYFKDDKEKGWLLKHACLIPFDQLDRITERVNELRRKNNKTDDEDFQEIDRRIIRHFGLFYKILLQKENK
jgi:tetrahydromethanopterin S-methyltransferase subunit G